MILLDGAIDSPSIRRVGKEAIMTVLNAVAIACAIGLLIYLFIAMLKPEIFS